MTDPLTQKISEQLTRDEKVLRDREIIEQAQKYFGGLTDRERELLGVGLSSAVNPTQVEARESSINEWIWAVLYGLVFAGVLVWVIRGR